MYSKAGQLELKGGDNSNFGYNKGKTFSLKALDYYLSNL